MIKLNNSLETTAGAINLLELSDQKPDNSQNDGFDHIEIYLIVKTYPEFEKILERKLFEKEFDLRKKVFVVQPHDHNTHCIRLENGFIVYWRREPLLSKVKREEMVY